MVIKKNTHTGKVETQSADDDDFYAIEKKRIAEEAQKAHKIHELDVQTHLTAMIPYFDDCEGEDRRRLLLLNSLLIHRFEEPGMMYWNIFRTAPHEIREYMDLFDGDFPETDCTLLITFLEQKKEESKNMVEMGFDEDGEEDDLTFAQNKIEEEDEIVDEAE